MNFRIPRHLLLTTLWLISAFTASQLQGQWRLKTLSWNIESADASAPWITDQISQLEGYDILALCEVDPELVPSLVEATQDGEGAKGDWVADFDYVIGQTGYNQRLMILWDNKRFERIDNAVEMNALNSTSLSFRSPLYVQLRHRENEQSFIIMVNHLARGNEQMRNAQTAGLVTWVKEQSLPVIALGDYNFDYDIDEGVGNAAFDIMTTSEDWTWVRPERILKSQSSSSYNSILDFAFVAHMPNNWAGLSEILSFYSPFKDDEITVDHRPLSTTFYIFPPEPEAPEAGMPEE